MVVVVVVVVVVAAIVVPVPTEVYGGTQKRGL